MYLLLLSIGYPFFFLIKVAGIFVTARKEVMIIVRDSVTVEETISNINDWVNRNAGLLLLSGALFLMGLLTFVVIVVAYRKGLLCGPPQQPKYNRPMTHNARIPSAALLDALNDLEYKAARGTMTAGTVKLTFIFVIAKKGAEHNLLIIKTVGF